jgi:hypothetical protein
VSKVFLNSPGRRLFCQASVLDGWLICPVQRDDGYFACAIYPPNHTAPTLELEGGYESVLAAKLAGFKELHNFCEWQRQLDQEGER